MQTLNIGQGLRQMTKSALIKQIQNALPEGQIVDKMISVDTVNDKKEVDYKSAFLKPIFNKNKDKKSGLAFGQFKSEVELGQFICSKFQQDGIIEEITCNEQAFVNIRLDKQLLTNYVNQINLQDVQFLNQVEQQTISVDFSSPNIAKVMHIAHLRSTILGESVCRIFEFMGQKVNRINHLGDWGTQFGMIIRFIECLNEKPEQFMSCLSLQNLIKQYQSDIESNVLQQEHRWMKILNKGGNFLEEATLMDLHQVYKDSYAIFKGEEFFKKESQLNVVRLQQGEGKTIEEWQKILKISSDAYKEIYKKLDIKIEDFGESYYKDKIPSTLEELKQKNLITEDNGAQCIFLADKKKYKNPLIVVKSDGGYNYDTTDMACIRYRSQELKSDKIIYITDIGQEHHFNQIFTASKMAGWTDNVQLLHLSFGIIQDQDGKRLKSRSGESYKLSDFLQDAKERCYQQLKQREEETGQVKFNEEELWDVAEKLSIASIKYSDLKQNGNYKFVFEKVLSTKGDTGVYLLYNYVRLCSIIRKSGLSQEQIDQLIANNSFQITHEHERTIIAQIIKFSDIVQQAANELKIGYLTDFVYDLSTKVSESMTIKDYKIIDPEFVKQRVLLIEAARKILAKTFELLGIQTLEKL